MKNLQGILIGFAAVLVFLVVSSKSIDTAFLLPVLGIFCLLYGIIGFINARKKTDAESSYRTIILQIIMGAVLLIIGVVDILHIEMSQTFWNIVLAIIVVVGLIWGALVRIRKK